MGTDRKQAFNGILAEVWLTVGLGKGPLGEPTDNNICLKLCHSTLCNFGGPDPWRGMLLPEYTPRVPMNHKLQLPTGQLGASGQNEESP